MQVEMTLRVIKNGELQYKIDRLQYIKKCYACAACSVYKNTCQVCI